MNMKIKLGIPSIGDRRAGRGTEYMHTSFLFNTNNKLLMKQLYGSHRHKVYLSNDGEWFEDRIKKLDISMSVFMEDMPVIYVKGKREYLHQDTDQDWYYHEPSSFTKSMNKFGEREINVPRVLGIGQNHSEDPLLFEVAKTVEQYLFGPTKKQYNLLGADDKNYRHYIGWKFPDGEVTLTIQRKKSSFYVDHTRMLKKDAIYSVAKILMRAVYCRSADVLEEYIIKVTETPHNVLYAIENRSPYFFYEMGRKQEVMLNTKSIGLKDVAIEISEDIWAGISTKEWNQFLNVYRHGAKRSKRWLGITPRDLWIELFTEDKSKDSEGKYLFPSEPTSGQEKMMLAWLKQNRKHAMVEDRATQLLRGLDAEYPQLTYVNWPGVEDQAIHVKGRVRDWVITGKGGMKVGHQNVSTYCVTSSDKRMSSQKLKFRGREISHSICIDNLHNNSSVGDQIAARAMVLLNDESASHRVYTIHSYVRDRATDDVLVNQPRIPANELMAIHYSKQKKRRQTKEANEAQKKAKAEKQAAEQLERELEERRLQREREDARRARRRERRARRRALQ